MNKTTAILPTILLTVLSYCRAANVTIGTNHIALAFVPEETRTFDTNRVANEFSRYFASGDSIESFFEGSSSLQFGDSVQINPGTYEGGLPLDAAADVVYFAPPNERIVVGEDALTWILGQFALADPLTNVWNQTEGLFSALTDGSITNDIAYCRETFVVNGAVCTNAVSDVEMLRGVQSHWTRITFYPPSVFGLRQGRLVEGGAILTGLRCRYSEPNQMSQSRPSYVLVYLDGRWRIVLE